MKVGADDAGADSVGAGGQESQVPSGKIGPGKVPFGSISPRQLKEDCGAVHTRSKSRSSRTPPIFATRVGMDPPCFFQNPKEYEMTKLAIRIVWNFYMV